MIKKNIFIEKLNIKKNNNSGLSEMQIFFLTKRIKKLNNHFKLYKKDNHSKIGLIKIISLRKRLLLYLKKNFYLKYKKIISILNLRK